MSKVEFYRCNTCGNIVVKLVDSGVPVVCCGEPMAKLVAGAQDASLEKHVPAVELDGQVVKVRVGSVEHPMTPEHYIQLICLVTEKGFQVAPLFRRRRSRGHLRRCRGRCSGCRLRVLQPPWPVGSRALSLTETFPVRMRGAGIACAPSAVMANCFLTTKRCVITYKGCFHALVGNQGT